MVDEAFWDGRRVLVTGHAGFKGSWLCAWLARLGAEVVGAGHPPRRPPSLFAAARLDARIAASREVDVRDAEALRRVVEAAAPEIVFHLAGQPLVLAGVREPASTFATNVMGTVNLLEGVRRCRGVRAVVVVTSDKCYRDVDGAAAPCGEDAPLGGAEPYGASKACAELAVAAYRTTYLAPLGVGLATARAGNVFGAGDMAEDRLIPDLVRACLDGRPAILRKAYAIRPWQHVLDALAGYLVLAERLVGEPERHAEAWNFGPDHAGGVAAAAAAGEVTVGQLAAAFLDELGGGAVAHAHEPSHHEAAALRLSASRAARRLGWRPLLALPEALRWTADGYARLLRAGDTGWLDEQIGRYSARLEVGRLAASRGRAGGADRAVA